MPQEQKGRGKYTLAPALSALAVFTAIGVAVATIVGGNAQNENAQGPYGNLQGQYAQGQNESPHPVPDGGSTVALLGLSAVLVEFARRRFAPTTE